MKNKLFFSSLIITSMLFVGINSSFAISDTLQMNVPEFFSAEVDSSSVLSGTLSYKTSDTVTIESPLNITYNIATNETDYGLSPNGGWPPYRLGNVVGLYTSVPVANNQTKRINPSSGKIIFTRADGTTTAAAVDNITGNSPSAANNANAIAFPITCTDSNYSYMSSELLNTLIGYQIDGEGQLRCTISGDSISGTYGQNDNPGNYISNIVLTHLYEDD